MKIEYAPAPPPRRDDRRAGSSRDGPRGDVFSRLGSRYPSFIYYFQVRHLCVTRPNPLNRCPLIVRQASLLVWARQTLSPRNQEPREVNQVQVMDLVASRQNHSQSRPDNRLSPRRQRNWMLRWTHIWEMPKKRNIHACLRTHKKFAIKN